jgi:hypothetical protein
MDSAHLSRRSSFINKVMEAFGFNLRFKIHEIAVPECKYYADFYPGITIQTLAERLERDDRPRGSSRHLNYSSASPGCGETWEMFVVVPLCQKLTSRMEFRHNPPISYPESILCDLLPGSSASADLHLSHDILMKYQGLVAGSWRLVLLL